MDWQPKGWSLHYNIIHIISYAIMNITIEEGGFTFSRSFEEHPAVEEALFASLYLLTKIYPPSEVKKGLVEVVEDIWC